MTEVGKIAAVALVAAVCAVTIRKHVPELAVLLALAAGVLIMASCAAVISDIIAVLKEIGEKGGLSQSLVQPVVKVIAISMITRMAAEICRDAKEGGLASAVEIAGTFFALFTVLPLILTLITLLTELL